MTAITAAGPRQAAEDKVLNNTDGRNVMNHRYISTACFHAETEMEKKIIRKLTIRRKS